MSLRSQKYACELVVRSASKIRLGAYQNVQVLVVQIQPPGLNTHEVQETHLVIGVAAKSHPQEDVRVEGWWYEHAPNPSGSAFSLTDISIPTFPPPITV